MILRLHIFPTFYRPKFSLYLVAAQWVLLSKKDAKFGQFDCVLDGKIIPPRSHNDVALFFNFKNPLCVNCSVIFGMGKRFSFGCPKMMAFDNV